MSNHNVKGSKAALGKTYQQLRHWPHQNGQRASDFIMDTDGEPTSRASTSADVPSPVSLFEEFQGDQDYKDETNKEIKTGTDKATSQDPNKWAATRRGWGKLVPMPRPPEVEDSSDWPNKTDPI